MSATEVHYDTVTEARVTSAPSSTPPRRESLPRYGVTGGGRRSSTPTGYGTS